MLFDAARETETDIESLNEKCKRNLFIWNYVNDLSINYGFLLLESTFSNGFAPMAAAADAVVYRLHSGYRLWTIQNKAARFYVHYTIDRNAERNIQQLRRQQ